MAVSAAPSLPRVALIGVSGYGRVYLDLLDEMRQAGGIVLTAATIVNPEDEPAIVARLGAQGCQLYSDYREMLDRHRGALDLCCIPTPIPLHAPMAVAALEAGAHVLVEKPLAATVREIEAVVAAEAAARRFLAVGFQDIYSAENRSLKADLLAGSIGRLRRIRGRGQWPRDTGYYRRNNWAGRRQVEAASVYDSPLSNAFSHFLNLALFLAGPEADRSAGPADVTAELYRAQPIENFDTAALRVRTTTGVEILFYVTHSCQETFEPELVLEGDAGRVIWRHSREIRVESAVSGLRTVPLADEQTMRRAMFQRVDPETSGPRHVRLRRRDRRRAHPLLPERPSLSDSGRSRDLDRADPDIGGTRASLDPGRRGDDQAGVDGGPALQRDRLSLGSCPAFHWHLPMKRHAFVMSVLPGQSAEYHRRHNPIWAGLADVLRAHGVHNYSIFHDPTTGQLFATVEIEDEARWQAIAQTDVCRRWWRHMSEIMPANPDGSPVSRPLTEVFHLD